MKALYESGQEVERLPCSRQSKRFDLSAASVGFISLSLHIKAMMLVAPTLEGMILILLFHCLFFTTIWVLRAGTTRRGGTICKSLSSRCQTRQLRPVLLPSRGSQGMFRSTSSKDGHQRLRLAPAPAQHPTSPCTSSAPLLMKARRILPTQLRPFSPSHFPAKTPA